MEHVICSSIMEDANKYNILYPLQHVGYLCANRFYLTKEATVTASATGDTTSR